jgi:hypothetical protein
MEHPARRRLLHIHIALLSWNAMFPGTERLVSRTTVEVAGPATVARALPVMPESSVLARGIGDRRDRWIALVCACV